MASLSATPCDDMPSPNSIERSSTATSQALLTLPDIKALSAEQRAELLRQLLAHEPDTRKNNAKPSTKTTSLFFKIIPLEIRRLIYGLLLVNPELGRAPTRDTDGSKVNYGLSPLLLAVCKQVHEEASLIMYEQNTMYAVFRRDDDSSEFDVTLEMVSPLTRFPRSQIYQDINIPLRSIPSSTNRFRHWRVYFAYHRSYYEESRDPVALFSWCRHMQKAPPKSIEFAIVPGDTDEDLPSQVEYSSSFGEALHLLRNVEKVIFRECQPEEIPVNIPINSHGRNNRPVPLSLSCLPILHELTELVTGNSPVIDLPSMGNSLTHYAQSFERLEVFRNALTCEHSMLHKPMAEWDDWDDWQSCETCNNFAKDATALVQHRDFERLTYSKLSECRECIRVNDEENFKNTRRSLMWYLDRRYGHIVNAATLMRKYVETNMRGDSNYFEEWEFEQDNKWEYDYRNADGMIGRTGLCGMILLEDYYNAIKGRKRTLGERAAMKLKGRAYELLYSNLPAERAIRHMQTGLRAKVYKNFSNLFKEALDDLDTQCSNISNARNDVFKHDILDEPGCSINSDIGEAIPNLVKWDSERRHRQRREMLGEQSIEKRLAKVAV